MPEQTLRPDGRPVELVDLGFTLVSTSLSARVETYPGSAPGTRSGGPGLTGPVLRSAGVRELGTVTLQDAHPTRAQAKQVELFIPAGGPDDGRLLLYIDENGGITFHLPQLERQPPRGIRAGREGLLRFEVPLRPPVAEPETTPKVRGIGGMLAKKVLKVIGWKVVGVAARRVGPPLVRGWESEHRPTRALSWPTLFDPAAPDLESLIPPAGRSLLFIHGTFSRAATAFAGLAEDSGFLREIQARYGDHIYGFDHATLGSGVATNVMQLYRKFAPGVHNLDIVCHSRGGLVARVLRDLTEAQLKQRFAFDTERGQYDSDLTAWGRHWRIPDGVQLKVNRILFVATPNSGTVLAQPTHLKKYLDILMTATNLLPDGFDVTVDAILTVAKLLLSEVMPVLPGLDDQQPQSSLLPLLAPTPRPEDAAIQTNYSAPPGLQAVMRAADEVADFIFGQKENDLVVPTAGVSQWAEVVFEPERCLPFAAERGVHHCNLFSQAETREKLLAWLTP